MEKEINLKTTEYFIANKPYEKKEKTACLAPYVTISIASLAGQKALDNVFDARIDTGADITCIPRIYASALGPLILGNPLKVRSHDGTINQVWTYRMIIYIQGYPDINKIRSYHPERGILLTDSNIGLIGMDIISKCQKLTFNSISQDFCLEF